MTIIGKTPRYVIIGDPIAQVPCVSPIGDVVMTEPVTALIPLAMRCGCWCVDGRDTHASQVDALTGFFASTPVPRLQAAEICCR